MGIVAARLGAALLGAVAAFQIALVLGAPWGALTQGGTHSGTLPVSGRIVAAISAALLSGLALIVLARVGQGPMATAAPKLITYGFRLTLAYSAIAVVLNVASPSPPERLLWGPFAIVLLACLVVVARSSRPTPAADHTRQ